MGLDQTSVQAELAAITRALECIPAEHRAHVFTDNAHAWARLLTVRDKPHLNLGKWAHRDLWARIAKCIQEGKLGSATWLPAHLSLQDFCDKVWEPW